MSTGSEGVEAAAELFRVLGSPSRLQLLRAIAEQATQVGVLAEKTGMSQPLVSQHLRLLRQTGIVRAERQGREATYRLTDRHIAHVIEDAVAHVLEEPRHREEGEPE